MRYVCPHRFCERDEQIFETGAVTGSEATRHQFVWRISPKRRDQPITPSHVERDSFFRTPAFVSTAKGYLWFAPMLGKGGMLDGKRLLRPILFDGSPSTTSAKYLTAGGTFPVVASVAQAGIELGR